VDRRQLVEKRVDPVEDANQGHGSFRGLTPAGLYLTRPSLSGARNG
jgi:hypothetical protein